MYRNPVEPFTVPNHGELINQMNDLCIAIKIHHTLPGDKENKEDWEKVKSTQPVPTWEDVYKLLDREVSELQDCRESIIKY